MEKKAIKKKDIICIVCVSVAFWLLVALGVFLGLWFREDVPLYLTIIIPIIVTIPMPIQILIFIAVLKATIHYATPGTKYENDRNYHNDFNLRMYACKNGRYIHKVLHSTKTRRIDHRDYDYKISNNYPNNFFNEIYKDEKKNERMDSMLNIIDSRVIDKTLFFEAKTYYGYAYAYIDSELKTYGLIMFTKEEARRRDEINRAKKRIVLESDRIIEEMDELFSDIKQNDRFFCSSYDEEFSVRDVLKMIKETINNE